MRDLFQFQSSYSQLPSVMFTAERPTPVKAPRLACLNVDLALELGLDPQALSTPAGVAVLAGNEVVPGSQPVAMAYSGHQFGTWVPRLGDGRALLLGELRTPNGSVVDIVLKGAGITAYSRSGDGRAALGPVLREYLVSEAMHRLGVPTTRALAVVTTGETVFRERPYPGAILVRVASSHLRVGTFQWAAAQGDRDLVQALAKYTMQRLRNNLVDAPSDGEGSKPDDYEVLLADVIKRQAQLVAKWMGLGFIHGVMNTDNMALSGETIDYGPCAMMDAFDKDKVFSSIDTWGRYAYSRQPSVAHWNLARFAETLLELLAPQTDAAIGIAQRHLQGFVQCYEDAWLRQMAAKLGLTQTQDADRELIADLLALMHNAQADFTLAFRALGDLPAQSPNEPSDASDRPFCEYFGSGDAALWLSRWRARLANGQAEPGESEARRVRQHAVNPALIPRNHLVQRAIDEAQAGDFGFAHRLERAWKHPYADRVQDADLKRAPRSDEVVHRTFCGT